MSQFSFVFLAHASTTKGISACGSAVPKRARPARAWRRQCSGKRPAHGSEPFRRHRLGMLARAAASSLAACSRVTFWHSMRPSLACATISPALPPVQPSSCAISSRTGCCRWRTAAREIARRRTSAARICRRRSVPTCAMLASQLRPEQRRSPSPGSAGPKRISTRVPTGRSTGVTLDHRRAAVALRAEHDAAVAGDDDERALPEASTAPATTRRPLPRAPRVGSRKQLGRDHRAVDGEQAGDLFRRAVDAGAVVLDEVAVAARQLADRTCARRRARCRPAPSGPAAAAASGGTPAFCCRPSMVRNSDQSGRSPIFKSGRFRRGLSLCQGRAGSSNF